MRTFRIIAHTADVRVKVAASSLEELFTVSLEGMNQILKRNFCKRKNGLPSTIHQIEISSADTTALLIDFLSEALTLSHIHGAIFCQVEFAELAAHSLTANLLGTQVKSFDEDIKAVSYHEAEIERNSRGNLQTNLVFDI